MTTPPRAVLFDADGVLQRTVPAWQDSVSATVGEESVRRHPALIAELAAAEGTATLTGAADLPASLTAVLDRHDVELSVDQVLDAWHAIEPFPDMVDGVRALEGRVVRALTTNQNPPRAAWMRAHLGFDTLFDASSYSCEMGLAKPDPGYFEHVLHALDVEPDEALFMDDTAANVEAAARLGLRAELFARHAGRAELDRILRTHGLG